MLLAGCLLLLACTGTAAETLPAQGIRPQDNHILQSAFWEDKTGQADIELAKRQAYTPYTGVLTRGYTKSVHWVRLTLAPSDEPLGLRLLPPWVDEITLYDPASTGDPITVGDMHPRQRNAFIGIGHFFELPASPTTRDVWLRLQSTSSHLLSAQAVSFERVAQLNTTRTIWSSLYSGLLFFLLLMLLPFWWTGRDRLLGIFLTKHVVYIYYGSAYLGLPTLMLSDWLSPAFLGRAFTYSTLLITPLALRFDIAFLSSYRSHPALLGMFKLIAWLSVANLLVAVAGYPSEALQVNLWLLFAAILIVMPTALSAKPDASTNQVMPKKVMVAYYALIICSLPLGLTSLLGWAVASEWTLYVLILHGVISVMMMTGILFVRANRLSRQGERVAWQLQQAQQETALEQRRRQEQSQFLHMLMHELKTPLSVVSMALGTREHQQQNLGRAGKAVQDMKAILDRCIEADQVGDLTLERRAETVDVEGMLRALSEAIPQARNRLRLTTAQQAVVRSDQQLVQIILSNLLDNASRYSDPVTPLHASLSTTVQGDKPGLSVHISNSPGQAGWPDPAQIFSKYYRSTGAQRETGSGLGLFLAHQLATSLGGSLHYEPTPDAVKFVLWLPQTPN